MKYVIIQLDGTYRETCSQVTGLSGISAEKEFRLDRLLETVHRVLKKRSAKKVLVIRGPEFSAPPFGALEEIHAQLGSLSSAGKEVWYYASDYGMTDLYLSSACTVRSIHPLGQVSCRGLARTGLFFRDLLEKHEVKAEVIRKGKYKSAADPFRCSSFDQYNRVQFQRLLDAAVQACLDTAASKRNIPRELLDDMMKGTTFSAEEAKEKKLIEKNLVQSEIISTWKGSKGKEWKLKKYSGRLGRGKAVTAVLFHEGAIDEGKNRKSSLIGQIIGDEAMVKEIEKLRDSKKVKAVVFRISSGGGSAVASENILKALQSLAEKKPLAVSMGPVAGSGGYWIAGAGKQVFCNTTTVTGSIGVISIFFELQKLLAAKGITTDTVKTGDMADIGSSLRPLTKEERTIIEHQIDDLYRVFVERTAEIRKLPKEKVEEIAQGRVWIGSDACSIGLTDQIGTLLDAVEWIQQEAGLASSKVRFYPKVKIPFVQKLISPKPAAGLVSASEVMQVFSDCRQLNAKALLLDITWYSWNSIE